MNGAATFLAACLLAAPAASGEAMTPVDASAWTLYVTNDNCPDYTWGFTEKHTRKAFADIVRAHLGEMTRTGDQPPPSRSRYNMAVTQEALCFLEHYPQREAELARRIKEGRPYLSPYLCNSLWAFQSVEGAIRTFYPARRLEKRWGITIDVAEHIEQPSLPWGAGSILAGALRQRGRDALGLKGFKRAVRTDLLERDRKPLRIVNGAGTVPLSAGGFAGVRRLP